MDCKFIYDDVTGALIDVLAPDGKSSSIIYKEVLKASNNDSKEAARTFKIIHSTEFRNVFGDWLAASDEYYKAKREGRNPSMKYIADKHNIGVINPLFEPKLLSNSFFITKDGKMLFSQKLKELEQARNPLFYMTKDQVYKQLQESEVDRLKIKVEREYNRFMDQYGKYTRAAHTMTKLMDIFNKKDLAKEFPLLNIVPKRYMGNTNEGRFVVNSIYNNIEMNDLNYKPLDKASVESLKTLHDYLYNFAAKLGYKIVDNASDMVNNMGLYKVLAETDTMNKIIKIATTSKIDPVSFTEEVATAAVSALYGTELYDELLHLARLSDEWGSYYGAYLDHYNGDRGAASFEVVTKVLRNAIAGVYGYKYDNYKSSQFGNLIKNIIKFIVDKFKSIFGNQNPNDVSKRIGLLYNNLADKIIKNDMSMFDGPNYIGRFNNIDMDYASKVKDENDLESLLLVDKITDENVLKESNYISYMESLMNQLRESPDGKVTVENIVNSTKKTLTFELNDPDLQNKIREYYDKYISTKLETYISGVIDYVNSPIGVRDQSQFDDNQIENMESVFNIQKGYIRKAGYAINRFPELNGFIGKDYIYFEHTDNSISLYKIVNGSLDSRSSKAGIMNTNLLSGFGVNDITANYNNINVDNTPRNVQRLLSALIAMKIKSYDYNKNLRFNRIGVVSTKSNSKELGKAHVNSALTHIETYLNVVKGMMNIKKVRSFFNTNEAFNYLVNPNTNHIYNYSDWNVDIVESVISFAEGRASDINTLRGNIPVDDRADDFLKTKRQRLISEENYLKNISYYLRKYRDGELVNLSDILPFIKNRLAYLSAEYKKSQGATNSEIYKDQTYNAFDINNRHVIASGYEYEQLNKLYHHLVGKKLTDAEMEFFVQGDMNVVESGTIGTDFISHPMVAHFTSAIKEHMIKIQRDFIAYNEEAQRLYQKVKDVVNIDEIDAPGSSTFGIKDESLKVLHRLKRMDDVILLDENGNQLPPIKKWLGYIYTEENDETRALGLTPEELEFGKFMADNVKRLMVQRMVAEALNRPRTLAELLGKLDGDKKITDVFQEVVDEATEKVEGMYQYGFLPIINMHYRNIFSEKGITTESVKEWKDSFMSSLSNLNSNYNTYSEADLVDRYAGILLNSSDTKYGSRRSLLHDFNLTVNQNGQLIQASKGLNTKNPLSELDGLEQNMFTIMNTYVFNQAKYNQFIAETSYLLDSIRSIVANHAGTEGQEMKNTLDYMNSVMDRMFYNVPLSNDHLSVYGLDLTKLSNAAMSMTQFTVLAANPYTTATVTIANIGNMLATTLGNDIMNVGSDKLGVFNTADFTKAMAIVSNVSPDNQKKIRKIADMYGIGKFTDKDFTTSRKYNPGKRKQLTNEVMMATSATPDLFLKYSVMIAQMIHDGVWEAHDNEGNYNEDLDKRFQGENGEKVKQFVKERMVEEGLIDTVEDRLTIAYTSNLRNKMESLASKFSLGGYEDINRANWSTNILFRMVFMFRQFLVYKGYQYFAGKHMNDVYTTIDVDDNGNVQYSKMYDEGIARSVIETVVNTFEVLRGNKSFKDIADPVKRKNMGIVIMDILLASAMLAMFSFFGFYDDEEKKKRRKKGLEGHYLMERRLFRTMERATQEILRGADPTYVFKDIEDKPLAVGFPLSVYWNGVQGLFNGKTSDAVKIVPGGSLYQLLHESLGGDPLSTKKNKSK